MPPSQNTAIMEQELATRADGLQPHDSAEGPTPVCPLTMYPTLEFAIVSFSLVFFIVDPLGNIPFFLALTEGGNPRAEEEDSLPGQRRHPLHPLFLCRGRGVDSAPSPGDDQLFPDRRRDSIFIIAISMLQARRSRARSTPEEEHDGREGEDVSIFPLAIPMMSGPAAITTVMVLISISKSYAQKGLVLLAILLTTLACYWILRESGRLLKILRRTGLNVLSRLMGLLLAVIAVQFGVDGIKAALIQIVPPK